MPKFPAVNEFVIFILKAAQQKVWVFENRTLRRLFRPRRNKITKQWRKLSNVK